MAFFIAFLGVSVLDFRVRYNHRVTPNQNARSIETFGLVIIALIILAITLVRFGRSISWSWR